MMQFRIQGIAQIVVRRRILGITEAVLIVDRTPVDKAVLAVEHEDFACALHAEGIGNGEAAPPDLGGGCAQGLGILVQTIGIEMFIQVLEFRVSEEKNQ